MDSDQTKDLSANAVSIQSKQAWRKEQGLELSVFLFLIVPSMVLSFFVVRQGKLDFVFVAVSTILRDLALLSLVLFFLWRNREPLERIGWHARKTGQELALGVVLFPVMLYLTGWLEDLLLKAGLTGPATPTPSLFAVTSRSEMLLAFVLVVVVAITEESIFRGYLVLRLHSVTRSTAAAVIVSSVIFAIGHGYEGTLGVVTVGFMGLVFALLYLWRGSLLAPIVMHFLQDFLAILILPLLGQK